MAQQGLQLVDQRYKSKPIPFNGRMITGEDPAIVGTNFRQLTNMRYTDQHPQGIKGMTKVNSSVMNATYLKVRSAFQFRKSQPAETHVLVQAYNSGVTASQVLQNKTAIPSAGNFEATALWTDSSGAGRGYFSNAPGEAVAYCNGVDSCIWTGDETECTAFFNNDPAGTFVKDFTEEISNTINTATNVATLEYVAGSPPNPNITYVTIVSPRALSGAKFYMGSTVNTASATCAGTYWNGTSYAAVSGLADGTSSGGVTLAQTGSITFTSTVGNARQRAFNGIVGYVYQFAFTGCDNNVTVYHCTLIAPMQTVTDVWDGIDRPCAAFYLYKSGYKDNTLNVYENSFSSSDATTYAQLDSLATGTQYAVFGCTERLMGINIALVPDKENTTADTTATVSYSDDGGVTWTSVGTIDDGTADGGISLAKSGTITWNPPAKGTEFESKVSRYTPLYHYKIEFDETLSGDVQLFYISGIPVPKEIGQYKFPIMAQDSLFLCADMAGKKHAAIHSAYQTNCVFNGDQSSEIEFGESGELTCGISLYNQFGSSLVNMIVFFKDDQMWKLAGNYPDWIKYCVDDNIGCPAPLTLKQVSLPADIPQGLGRNVIIWQGAQGVYISDGRSPVPIGADIKNYFDPNHADYIGASVIGDSTAFFDDFYNEYHLCNGDLELVFDLRRWRWYKVDRTSGKRIKCGISVKDTDGNSYNFGFIDTGYMERLEYGTTFDGESIVHTMWTGDILPGDDLWTETEIERFNLIHTAKTTSTATITYTHYVDGETTGTNATAFSQTQSGKRIKNTVLPINSDRGVYHSFKLTVTTSNETIGFEPLAGAWQYTDQYEHAA